MGYRKPAFHVGFLFLCYENHEKTCYLLPVPSHRSACLCHHRRNLPRNGFRQAILLFLSALCFPLGDCCRFHSAVLNQPESGKTSRHVHDTSCHSCHFGRRSADLAHRTAWALTSLSRTVPIVVPNRKKRGAAPFQRDTHRLPNIIFQNQLTTIRDTPSEKQPTMGMVETTRKQPHIFCTQFPSNQRFK